MAAKIIMRGHVTVDNTILIQEEMRKKLRAAMRQTLEDMKHHAQSTVPVDTGLLQSSIRTRMQADGMGGQVMAGNQRPGAHYAIYVEEGHHMPQGTWVPPRPYIRPAAEMGQRLLQARLANF